MSDEAKFVFDKGNFVMGALAGAVGTALLSIAVPDTSHQFVQEARERYLGLRHRKHHKRDRKENGESHVSQLAVRQEEETKGPQR